MYRVLANMGLLLSKQRIVLPADAVAQTEVKNQARLPELK
jgi:adhesin transport system outer membrane protein